MTDRQAFAMGMAAVGDDVVGAGGAGAATDTAQRAIEILSDGVRGYEAAEGQVEDFELRALMRELGRERRELVESFLRLMSDEGVAGGLDTDGSIAGAIHRGWIATKGLVAGDSSIVESARGGENRAIDEIRELLETDISEELGAALRSALSAVQAAELRLEAWAAEFGADAGT